MSRRWPWLVVALLAGCATRARSVAPLAGPVVERTASEAAIGTAHPLRVFAVDPGERWVGLCQAREDSDGDGKIAVHDGYPTMTGDVMRPYLVLGAGPGVAIDDYIGADASGDTIVVLRGGRIVVHHVRTGRSEAIGRADLEDDADTEPPFAGHRAAALEPVAGVLAYHLRGRGGASELVVRRLASGTSRRVALPGRLHRAYFSPGGAWLLLSIITGDSDGDGALELSRTTPPHGPRACHGDHPMHHFDTIDERGDRASLYAMPVAGGELRAVPRLLEAMGDLLLVRERDAAIVALAADGRSSEWVPAQCEGTVLGLSLVHRRALVRCERWPQVGGPLEIHGPGVHRVLHVRPGQRSGSLEHWDRFAGVVGVDGEHIIDLVNFNEWRVPDGYDLFAVNERGGLLRIGEHLVQWDLRTATMVAAPDPWAQAGDLQVQDGRALVVLDRPAEPASGIRIHGGFERETGPLVWRERARP